MNPIQLFAKRSASLRSGRRRGARALGLALAVACSLTFASACSSSGGSDNSSSASYPSSYPASYSKLVSASKKEHGVVVYGNLSADIWQPILAGFNKLYPWISVKTLDLPDPGIFQRYYAESKSGAATADLLESVASDQWWQYINTFHAGLAYDSPEASALPDSAKPSPGVYLMSADPLVVAYNKKILSKDEQPHSMADLAKSVTSDPAKFKNKIATYDLSQYDMWWTMQNRMGTDKFKQLFQTIGGASNEEVSSGSMMGKVLSGEYTVAYYMSLAGVLDNVKGPGGETVGWTYSTDGTPVFNRAISIPEHAANPNSAKLLLDFLLSKTGQEIVSKTSLVPVRSGLDVPSDAVTLEKMEKKVGAKNLYFIKPEEAMVTDHDSFTSLWNELFH